MLGRSHITVVDLEGVGVGFHSNPPLARKYFNFMEKLMRNQVKRRKRTPLGG